MFWNLAAPLYNVIAYPFCVSLLIYLLWPLIRCLRRLRRGESVDEATLLYCRRRLVNFPFIQLIINPLAWMPGAFFFPWMITRFGGPHELHESEEIWWQFSLSFLVSTVFTTVQTFFMLQTYLTTYMYPDFFKDARPERVAGIIEIPFNIRLIMLWVAIALMPLAPLLAVTANFYTERDAMRIPYWFPLGLTVVSVLSGGSIFWLVGRDLWRWMHCRAGP